MPQIPFDPLPTVAPAGAPGVFEHVDTNPEMFGASVAQATRNLGGATEGFASTIHEAAIKQMREYNETAVDQSNTTYESGARDIAGNFRTLRGEDALNARPDTLAQIEQLRQQVRGNLASPEQQRMFDIMSRRSQRAYLDEVTSHALTEGKVWQGDVATGAIANKVNESATYWNDTPRFAQALGDIQVQAGKLAQLKGIDPASDAGKTLITHYTSEAWQARIRSVMATDPDTARALFDANADQLDAAHRATLDAQITQHQYMSMVRDESQQRRDDAQAQRDMQTTQAGNLATLTADTLKGKPINFGAVADLVRTQQLAPHAVEFLMSLQKQRSAGPEDDRADAVIALHTLLHDPSASVDDKTKAIGDAVHHGAIKAATAGTLVDQAYQSDSRSESSTERDAKSAVLAAAGVPDGMLNLGNDEKQRKAQVLTEWQNHMLKGDDPIETRDDMIQRYTPSGVPPATWARPRFGPVASTADVATVAAKTKQALASGQITADQARSEGVLLNQYSGFYQQLESARAAAAAAQAKKPQSGGAKAKVRGVTRTED